MPETVIPLIGPPQQRSTGTGDQRFVNVLFEKSVNETPKEQTIYCVKRPGLVGVVQPTGGAAAGRTASTLVSPAFNVSGRFSTVLP